MREYSFTVDDKVYILRYDFNAVCDIEEKAGFGIPELMSQKRVGFSTARIVIWGGLTTPTNKMTIYEVGDLLQKYIKAGNEFEELVQKSMNLLAESISNDESDKVIKKKTTKKKK